MTRIPKTNLLAALVAATLLSHISAVIAAPQVKLCQQATRPTAPVIEKVTRSDRTDGVWHDIFIRYSGKPDQKLTLRALWEAQTPAEDGKGSISSKSQSVRTDASGQGRWTMEVKGYPAGKMHATVQDESGETSQQSAAFDVPWIY